mgnify:CR=1 FL=1
MPLHRNYVQTMNLSKRQTKCIAALKASGAELAQPDHSASWGVECAGTWVRLCLTGGDVWQLVKSGIIVKHATERRFTLRRQICIIPMRYPCTETEECVRQAA